MYVHSRMAANQENVTLPGGEYSKQRSFRCIRLDDYLGLIMEVAFHWQ